MSFRRLPDQSSESQPSAPTTSYKRLPDESESLSEAALRHGARSASRVAETVAGAPGDIVNAPTAAVKYITEKIAGKIPESLKNAIEIVNTVSPIKLPTSGELKEKAETLSHGYLQAKGKGEELSDAIISDFASLALPAKGKIPFVKSAAIAVGSNLAGKGVELLGGGENAQTATKIASTIILSAINPKGAEKYAGKLYKDAEGLLPANATVNAKNLLAKLDNLSADLHKGGTAPYKAPIIKKVEEIVDKVKSGSIKVDELAEFKRDLNQSRGALYLEQNLDRNGRRMAKRNFDKASNIVNETLNEYGQTNQPWSEKFRSADQAYGAIAQSKKVSSVIGKYVKQHPKESIGLLAAEAFLAPGTLPYAIGAYGGLKAGELIARISKSPILREYYQGVLEAAIKDDTAALGKYLNKLDAGLKKEQKD
jgi:hypothetical protein